MYNTYIIDSLKNEELVSEYDTIKITGDTLVNGEEYMIFYGKHNAVSANSGSFERLYRDSLEYIIDLEGKIIFSQKNFTNTLYSFYQLAGNDTMFHAYAKMEIAQKEINLQAGNFDSVLNYHFSVINWEIDNKWEKSNDYLYAPNVGKILWQFFYYSQYYNIKSYYEVRLVDYHIADYISKYCVI